MRAPHERRARLRLDFEVVARMNGDVFHAAAYASMADLAKGREPIESGDRAGHASAYLVEYFVPTLIGPGRFAETTSISVDLNVADYPYGEPATAIASPHVPFSPHFRAGMPVCTGEIWREHHGRMLLGSLLVHIARLLNWDEQLRGGGYEGWNGEAIAYHRANYGSRPLNPGLRYPALPTEITHGQPAREAPLFGRRVVVRPVATDALFSPRQT